MQHQLWTRALFVVVLIGLYRWCSSMPGRGPEFAARTTAELKLPYMEFAGTLEQSAGDMREHRVIKLPNNLVVLCTRDPDATQAAATLHVDVGSLADPPELNGLAHFLEHMLFMGTEKYPDEGEYIAFIKKNGGQYNAFTSLDTTGYYFGVANSALEQTLDRFSRFFIDPLFAPGSVDRELHAVDSEHKGNLQDDYRREFQLERLLSNSSHPFSMFSTGNLETLRNGSQRLGLDIRQEMIRFYQKHYSADIMRLVVAGNYSVDQLIEWSAAKFSAIASKGDSRPASPGHPLTPGVLGKIVRYQTLRNVHRMRLQFAVPELKAQYRTRPDKYVIHLVELQSPGSLFDYLKAQGLATEIYAYISTINMDGFNIFDIVIDLTPKGFEHYEGVVRAVFAYLRVLADSGPQRWLHDERRVINDLEYRFYENPGVVKWTLTRARVNLNSHVAPKHYLSAGNSAIDYDADAIAGFMAHLRPHNYRLFLGAQSHGNIQLAATEKYYGTPYLVDDLSANLVGEAVMEWHKPYRLHLPDPNPFVPESTKVVSKSVPDANVATAPTLLQSTDGYELWFKQDDQFAQPRGYIRLHLAYERSSASSLDRVIARILDECVNHILDKELSNAKISGMDYKVIFRMTGVDVKVTGFSDKLPHLLEAFIKRLKALDIEEHVYHDSLTLLQQDYQNRRNMQPFRQLHHDVMPHLNQLYAWAPSTLEQQLQHASIGKVRKLAASAFDSTRVKLLVSGNFREADAMDIARNVQQILNSKPLPATKHTRNRVVDIAPGHYIYRSLMADNSSLNGAVLTTVYCGARASPRDRVLALALKHIIDNPLFNQLRTKEQLGYVVAVFETSYDAGQMILTFLAQSEANPAYLTQRIDKFIREIRQHIANYSASDFDAFVQALVSLKTTKLESIEEEADRFWRCVSLGTYDFDFVAQEVAQLKMLSKSDLLEYWDQYVNPDTAPHYTRVDTQLWPALIAYPSESDLVSYPESVIALSGCLDRSGLSGVSTADLARF
ncbi:metalloprotease, partial [Coemansia sp. RSA 2702]